VEYAALGNTGLEVSRFCFGTLPMGPLQSGLDSRECRRLLEAAWELGVNFFDTADLYQTYPHLEAALSRHPGAVVASKSYAHDARTMARDLERALRELGRDVVDIFLLHEQESVLTLSGHREALDCLLEQKARGRVRAVGVSTHVVEVVEAAGAMAELDVIHPLINLAGIGIQGGGRADMEAAIARAARAGKGVYTMKALAGGHLYGRAREALRYAAELTGVSAVAVGVKSVAELEVDIAWLLGYDPPARQVAAAAGQARSLLIEEWCRGCGACAASCSHRALSVEAGRARADLGKCVLCGYCAAACAQFCIKVV